MGEFLENLKNAVEEGEFNSDAAKKINAIDEKAGKINPQDAERLIEKRLEESGGGFDVEEKEMKEKNIAYDREMEEIKYNDLILKQIATIKDMEHMVTLSVQDMFQFLKTIEENYAFDKEKEGDEKLLLEIERVRTRFQPVLVE